MSRALLCAALLAFSLTVTPTTVTLQVGESAQLVTVPSNGVQFSSADPTIASVTSGGLVVGRRAGTVTIVARKGRDTASVLVRVLTPPMTGSLYLLWDHDTANVAGFRLDVDGTEHDLGALAPFTGTTYRTNLATLGYRTGVAYDITVIAYTGSVRSDAAAVTLTW